jgi:hypothetical protein
MAIAFRRKRLPIADRCVRHSTSSALLLLLLFALNAAAAQSQTESELPIAPPRMTKFRHDESYAYLRTPSNHLGHWWEPYKYLSLGTSESAHITLGLEARFRHEDYRNPNWGETPVDSYQWYRVMPYADWHLSSSTRLFGQVIGSQSKGKETPETGVDETGWEVLQAFIDSRHHVAPSVDVEFRAGRWLMAYGSERLLGVRYGPNVLRSFNGGRSRLTSGPWQTDAFFMRPVQNKLGSFNDGSNDERAVAGIYTTRHLDYKDPSKGVDIYYLRYRNESAKFVQGAATELRHTVGLRHFNKSKEKWDWDIEGAWQWGEFGHSDIRAWTVATNTGYTFKSAPYSPRIGMQMNASSGDSNLNDRHLGTFDAFFPNNKIFGEAGLIGPGNLINVNPTLSLDLPNRMTLQAAMNFYWRHKTADGIYDPGVRILRRPGASTERRVGTQADLALGWRPDRTFSAEVFYSVFEPGPFIRETGPSRTTRLIGTEVTFKF